jgi:sarcosine oxidase subunit delta
MVAAPAVVAVQVSKSAKGLHTEFWQHTLGCRRWLVVQRNTVSHDIASVVPAAQRALP